ncbi:MAG: hypothetical protein M1819_001689 [Sarea resinae]|nr:MAG: hypothetical protein M1819_001689 [Sarea resinae]
MVGIFDCPDEILEAVIEQVALPTPTREHDLCSLALSCRRLCSVSTSFLYQDVSFSTPPEAFSMQNIYHSSPDHFLAYDRIHLFLRTLDENPGLAVLVQNIHIWYCERSETEKGRHHTDDGPSWVADIKHLLQLVPKVQVLDIYTDPGINPSIFTDELSVAEALYSETPFSLARPWNAQTFPWLREVRFAGVGAAVADFPIDLFWSPKVRRVDWLCFPKTKRRLQLPPGKKPFTSRVTCLTMCQQSREEDEWTEDLRELLTWPAALEEFTHFGSQWKATTLCRLLEPHSSSLKYLDLGNYCMTILDLSQFENLVHYTTWASCLLASVTGYDFFGILIWNWPPCLQCLQINNCKDMLKFEHFPYNDEGPARFDTPLDRSSRAILDVIRRSRIGAPHLRRILVTCFTWDDPDVTRELLVPWSPPPIVVKALEDSGIVLDLDIPPKAVTNADALVEETEED